MKEEVSAKMQEERVIIREAELTDIFALTELMNELGYNTTQDEMKTRFQNIQNHKDYKTFITPYICSL